MPRNLLIYRSDLLAMSEPFVLNQGEALSRFRAFYVGRRRVPGVNPPSDRTILLESHRLQSRLARGGWPITPSAADMQRLRQLDPLLVHAHFGPDGAAAIAIAKSLDIPLLVTFHGYDINVTDRSLLAIDGKLALYLLSRKRLMRSASCFIAVSQFIRAQLLRKGFPDQKIVTHYIGIDPGLFCPSPTISRENMVLFVGRLVANKGCEFMLRAMQKVQAVQCDTKIVVIGEGDQRSRLEKLAAELRLRNCTFLGARPSGEVRSWMNRAKVFCVPSIEVASGASEGFGLVFCEAQSRG